MYTAHWTAEIPGDPSQHAAFVKVQVLGVPPTPPPVHAELAMHAIFPHGSPEQQSPGAHAMQDFVARHTPQPRYPALALVHPDGSQLMVGQSAEDALSAQQGLSWDWQSRPQWCCPSGQSFEPIDPAVPQQYLPVVPEGKTAWQPRSLTKQPVAWLVQ